MTSFVAFAVVIFTCLSTLTNAQFDPNCFGNRRTMTHLFEWRWADIALECERFLSKKGYCGVQVSPPNEHRVFNDGTRIRPWWERYQPVSFKMYSRSGDEAAFIDMVKRCNDVGVRIYVDAVVNHMAQDNSGDADQKGIGGTVYNPRTLQFPGVPYGPSDFNKKCDIYNYGNPTEVRNCRLAELVDLDHSKDYVRGKIAEWMNRLVDWGVAGFRIDAAKHMWPEDLRNIISRLKDLPTQWFKAGSKPFVFQEVIDMGGEPISKVEYTGFGRVTEFGYGKKLSEVFNRQNPLKWCKNFGEEWGLMPSSKALVFIDNHDNQRGHGGGGAILNFFVPRAYKMAVTYMLAWPYGVARVMSSFRWERNFQNGHDVNDWHGPPHDSNYNTLSVKINLDDTCGDGWVCEHRWRQIYNMAMFRNIAGDEPVANWWDDGDYQIAFSRTDRAFYAVNAGGNQMSVRLMTGMRPGRYCDVVSGNRAEDGLSCTGKVITVEKDGWAQISISSSDEDPMVAIHLESILVDSALPTVPPTPPVTDPVVVVPTTAKPTDPLTPPPGYKRTLLFIQYNSTYGDSLFYRGGISVSRRPACEASPTACYVPISYSHVKYETKLYDGYNAWSKGDTYLDWQGVQPNQGDFNGKAADGSPAVWTTNGPVTDAAYNPLNEYGRAYWMLDIMMECSATENGWFEFKVAVNGKLEGDIAQFSRCAGSARAATPYKTNNHLGKCGHKNVYVFNGKQCYIDVF